MPKAVQPVSECLACKRSYVEIELKLAPFIENIVNIYKNLDSTLNASLVSSGVRKITPKSIEKLMESGADGVGFIHLEQLSPQFSSDSKEDGHSSVPSSKHRNTQKRPVDKDVYGTKLESNGNWTISALCPKEVPWSNERPLENKELNAVIGAWFTLGIIMSVQGYLNCLHPFIAPLPSIYSAVIHLKGMSTIIQGLASSCINGCISHTSFISETEHSEAADVSSEVEILSDMPVTKNVVERKQDKPNKGSKSNSELFLDQLGLDLTGTIIVMLGRMWDVSAVTGRYLSTDFVVSNAKEASILLKFLLSNLTRKDEYQILKNEAYMLEFDGSTTIRKASVKISHLHLMDVFLDNQLFFTTWASPSGLHFEVTIDGIKTRKGWNFPSCGSDTYSLMDIVDKILPSKGIEDGVGSSNLDDYPDNQPQKLKRIVQDPSIVTPSKPIEEKKPRMDIEDSETKDSSDLSNATGKKGPFSLLLRKGKTGVMTLESCMTILTRHRGPKIISWAQQLASCRKTRSLFEVTITSI
uniref:Replication protein A 70 kDa DNA-binding subunit C-like n=1 Tax=Tanacetum cinerariifolium TaxID=118510 RepID=A0A6L2KVE3_TANCI|nr:replication protein A 70 kDa DNA-binding subunit C-like [Tanacetum cinerariifolium]